MLEIDSMTANQMIQDESIEFHHSAVLRAIKEIIQCLWMIRVTHVFKEGNRVADGLALMIFSSPLGTYSYMLFYFSIDTNLP